MSLNFKELLPNCPICKNQADWISSCENSEEIVYFCMNCIESFTNNDTLQTLHEKSLYNLNIIDEQYIKKHNEILKNKIFIDDGTQF